MSNVVVNKQDLTNIADAIRTKSGSQSSYLPSEMAIAINNICDNAIAVKIDNTSYSCIYVCGKDNVQGDILVSYGTLRDDTLILS